MTLEKENISPVKKSTNVIKFPEKQFNLASKEALDDMREQMKLNKMEFVEFVSAEVMEDAFFKVVTMGFDIGKDAYAKDTVMVVEALKSLLLKTMGIEHGIQQAVDKLIVLEDELQDEIED
jgi:hypothetical protein